MDRIEDLPEDEWNREVYARAGLALSSAQAWERGMVRLAVLTRAQARRYADVAEWDSDEAALSSLTAGTLRRRVLTDGLVDAAMVEGWAKVLKARNHLAHEFFWEHAVDFSTLEGRQRMVDALDAMAEQFDTANAEARVVVQRAMAAWGAGPEDMRRWWAISWRRSGSATGRPDGSCPVRRPDGRGHLRRDILTATGSGGHALAERMEPAGVPLGLRLGQAGEPNGTRAFLAMYARISSSMPPRV